MFIKREPKYPNLKKVLSYYKRYMGLYIPYLFIVLFNACVNFLNVYFLGKMITAMTTADYDTGIAFATGLSIMLLTSYGFSLLNTFLFKTLENKVKIDLQNDMVKQMLDIKMKYFDELGTGGFSSRLTGNLASISVSFKSITETIVQLLSEVSYIFYIWFINPYLALLVFTMVIIKTLVYSLRVHFIAKLKPSVLRSSDRMNSSVIEIIRGARDIKTAGESETVMKILEVRQREYIKEDNHEWFVGIAMCRLADVISNIFDLLFIFLSVFLLKGEYILAASFYTAYLYKNNIKNFASVFGDFRSYLRNTEICAERVFSLCDESVFEHDVFGDKSLADFSGRIRFSHVRFFYNEENIILNDASFEIKPNQMVAFVGESGSGKTTILNLISHLYYKKGGNIYFDDMEISDINRESQQNNVVSINQSPYIFNLSIKRNFLLVNENLTDDDIWELCRKVGLADTINDLPEKLDTLIGEGGSQFSGGQRQKLCVAKMLATNAKVLIFDESTSAMDNTTQSNIMSLIKSLKQTRTIIIVAHRLSTIEDCDNIFLLRGGSIVANGTHKELLQNSEYYRELYSKQ